MGNKVVGRVLQAFSIVSMGKKMLGLYEQIWAQNPKLVDPVQENNFR